MTVTATAEPIEGVPVIEPDAPPVPTIEEIGEQPTGVMELATPSGVLTIDPSQKRLTPQQRAAFSAITNADPDDPQAAAHVGVFLHVCQKMRLDPWQKQAYLIQRGEGQYAKFTIQVGIDGYRAVAQRTRLISGSATLYWTGQDDDPDSWFMDRDDDGMVVKRRLWFDEWPDSRGYPGAAKAVVKHYDAFGNLVKSDAVAHWGMYAPFFEKKEWREVNGRNRKVAVTDDNGKPVMELSEMWSKGSAHMLGKCAEALVLRKVFPDEFAGTVTFEEMHRADAEDRRRQSTDAGRARKAFAASQRAHTTIAATAVPASTGPSGGPASDPGAAAPAAAAEPEQAAGLDEGTARRRLLAELDTQAELMGTKVPALCKRQIAARKQNVEDFPVNALSTMVLGFRPMVVERLRGQGRGVEADRYAGIDAEPVEDIAAVFAGAEPDDAEPVAIREVLGDMLPADDGGEPDGEEPPNHPYEDDGSGACTAGCGEVAGAAVHQP